MEYNTPTGNKFKWSYAKVIEVGTSIAKIILTGVITYFLTALQGGQTDYPIIFKMAVISTLLKVMHEFSLDR
jgi:hypothetical protein